MTRRFRMAAFALCGLSGWAAGEVPTVRPPVVLPEPMPPPRVIDTLPLPIEVPPPPPGVIDTLPLPIEVPPPPPATLPPAEATVPATAATGPAPTPAPDRAPPPTEKTSPAAAKPSMTVVVSVPPAEASPITVSTRDGDFKLILGGAVVADFLYSTERPLASGTPFFLLPDSPFGLSTRTFDAHARQTNLFAIFSGPEVFDFKTGGFVFVNLYDNSIIQDRYGLLPINAFGELRNDDWRFAAGYQMDVFNPLNPTVLPFSYLASSGNLGLFRGQARVEHFLHDRDDVLVTLTAAVSEPIPTTFNDAIRVLSEDNGVPNAEGRVAIALGPVRGAGLDAHRAVETGVSAVCGQIRSTQGPVRIVSDVWGLGADGRWNADPRWGVQGEAYVGQGLGTYGASGLQNVNPITLRAIRSAGGWVECFYYWCPDSVHTHVGYGIDDPLDRDAGATIPLRNETYYATTIWDVTKSFRVGLQASYLRTTFATSGTNEGFIFQTQFMWKF